MGPEQEAELFTALGRIEANQKNTHTFLEAEVAERKRTVGKVQESVDKEADLRSAHEKDLEAHGVKSIKRMLGAVCVALPAIIAVLEYMRGR